MLNFKLTFTIIFCLIASFKTFSQDLVPINSIHFNLDENEKLILINQDVTLLNDEFTGLKSGIETPVGEFNFQTPVEVFIIGQTYEVMDSEGIFFELYFSELPILRIQSSETIVDEPRTHAYFSFINMTGIEAEGSMGIEFRGGYSQVFPKKSYRIEFWTDETGVFPMDYSLAGMRSDDDWNLDAMYNQPLRVRSKMNFELWNEIDVLHYEDLEPTAYNGVHQEYVEVFIDEQYQGVYTLGERVDRKQLQLKESFENYIQGEIFKGSEWGITTLDYIADYTNLCKEWDGFEIKYPPTYEWKNIYDFVDFVVNSPEHVFYSDYENRFYVDNAVNYFIFINLLSAYDNLGKNAFIARYSENDPYFYVPWDLDGTYGILWSGEKNGSTENILSNGFYDRLLCNLEESSFSDLLSSRWNQLRQDIITREYLEDSFTKHYSYLNSNGVYKREQKKWNECEFIDLTNMDYTFNYIKNRISFLDELFNSPEVLAEHFQPIGEAEDFYIYPNPASDYLIINHEDSQNMNLRFTMINQEGHTVMEIEGFKCNKSINVSKLPAGIYFVILDQEGVDRKIFPVVLN